MSGRSDTRPLGWAPSGDSGTGLPRRALRSACTPRYSRYAAQHRRRTVNAAGAGRVVDAIRLSAIFNQLVDHAAGVAL